MYKFIKFSDKLSKEGCYACAKQNNYCGMKKIFQNKENRIGVIAVRIITAVTA